MANNKIFNIFVLRTQLLNILKSEIQVFYHIIVQRDPVQWVADTTKRSNYSGYT